MKVSYFAYCLKNTDTEERVLFNLQPFLRAFTQHNNIQFKSQFTYQGEHLYLLHNVGDTYLFLITRSQEIIKKIDTANLTVGEIHQLLSNNEELGFASYVLFKENFFSYASTLLAPKVDVFSDFVNQIISTLNIGSWEFVPQALLHQATKADALAMTHIGRTTIELSKQNSVLQDFFNSLAVNDVDTHDMQGIEIVIKPKLRQNIKPVIDKVIQNIPDQGIEKMIVRAKEDFGSQLTDLYLVSSGQISDNVDKSREERIPELLESKAEQNEYLGQKLSEYLEDEFLEENSVDGFVRYSDVAAWPDNLPDL